jgi:hypothetical protein
MGLPDPGLTPTGVPEDRLPVGAIILRAIGQAENQVRMLMQSAELSDTERFAQGLAIGRRQAAMSVDLLLQNTGLPTLPGCALPAATLGKVRKIADGKSGMLTRAELQQLAQQYALAQEQLRVAFERLPEADQDEGLAVEEQLRAADERAKSPYWSDGGQFEKGRLGLGDMAEDDEERRVRLAELDAIMRESQKARQRLGQRTAASELKREGLQEALYGKKTR